jgi:non-heme chloroperoxidase
MDKYADDRFSETDMTEDLKKIDVPTLSLHGDDDEIVAIADAAMFRRNW